MTVKVLFFAQLKDVFGTGERMLQVEACTTVGELAQSLFSGVDRDPWKLMSLRYAVNEEFVAPDTKLKDQDVLAILPPMSGG
ncbi:MAG: molybdopterin converting factor subunit 1 [Omnitrophica bacterium RIFCSPLOWO2_12_FULL_50_11]|nr:MAG: molybdopterin converting factor subunit 1 [Omnitrophica bacterium RIFCSPLOWO2_12_FULL_50_11]